MLCALSRTREYEPEARSIRPTVSGSPIRRAREETGTSSSCSASELRPVCASRQSLDMGQGGAVPMRSCIEARRAFTRCLLRPKQERSPLANRGFCLRCRRSATTFLATTNGFSSRSPSPSSGTLRSTGTGYPRSERPFRGTRSARPGTPRGELAVVSPSSEPRKALIRAASTSWRRARHSEIDTDLEETRDRRRAVDALERRTAGRCSVGKVPARE